MKLPEITRQIGTGRSDRRVYIEDYVYTYLQQLRGEQEILPLRVALYGRACINEEKKYYFIYGAADVIEELERGRDEEQIRKEFFSEYELIGYVNVYGDRGRLTDRRGGYFIFYENNEAMQNYLVSRYERNKRQTDNRRDVKFQEADLYSKGRRVFSVWEILKNLLYGCMIVFLAVTVTVINDYQKMSGFVEAVSKAVTLAQTIG